MTDTCELRRLQEWMCGAITGAEGGRLDMDVDQVICSTPRLSAADRLEVYRRGYRLRLLESLRVCYPTLRHLLGPELFDDFGLDYIGACRSRGRSLQTFAEGLAAHLVSTRPRAPEAEPWQELITDLAGLEQMIAEVREAPGPEGRPLLSAAVLPRHPNPRGLAAVLRPVECLRLHRAAFPVGPYVSSVRRGEKPPLPEPGDSFVALNRHNFVVTLTPLTSPEYRFLRRLAAGVCIGAAATAADFPPLQAWEVVRDWAARDFFLSMPPDRRSGPARPECRQPGRPKEAVIP